MKKKLLSVLLSTAMVAALLVGCSGDADTGADAGNADGGDDVVADGGEDVPEWVEPTYEYSASTSDDGTVLNIYCWNEEFMSRIKDHYPGYVDMGVDEVTGNPCGDIDGMKVVWTIVPSDENAYQNNLDATLVEQETADADKKIDIFLVEADYAVKYIDTNYTLALSDLGITDADLANQYQYTKDVVTDMHGNLKGSSWQGCPGVLIYNRDAAAEVLLTEDPTEVQAFVSDWDKFNETATKMQEAGYSMVSSVNDTYRVYSNNVTSKWVENGVINIDDNLKAWVDDSKAMVDAEVAGTHDLWSKDWEQGFYPTGKVFCYFGPAWLVNFCMAADVEGSIANLGRWGAVEGPQGFFWGGTWICAANGTDNESLVKDIILKMTADEAILEEIVLDDDDFANNTVVMDKIAASNYQSAVYGGQNPISTYAGGVSKVDLSNLSKYDQGCNESFQKWMKEYFLGNMTYEEAEAKFIEDVIIKYPELEPYN